MAPWGRAAGHGGPRPGAPAPARPLRHRPRLRGGAAGPPEGAAPAPGPPDVSASRSPRGRSAAGASPGPGRAGPGRAGGAAAHSPSSRDRAARRGPPCPAPVPLRSSRLRSRCPARPCPALPPHPALNRSKQRCGAGAAASVPAAAHPPPGSGEQRRSGLSSPRRQRQPGLGAAGVTAGPGMPQPGARAALPQQSGPEGSAARPPHGSSRFCPREGRRSSHRPPPCRRKLGAAKRTFWHFGVGQWSRGMH
ncbi:basic proline-rich protein-like [Molothrus ater]|uniref:basic proline-rich protein-like n=1 Tax=Molothrus ater TaxID=84834 RepID=UPI0023E8734A|nr:basic proline-rich protein-like [Molothrus ater]